MTNEDRQNVRTFWKLNDLLFEASLKDRDFSAFVDEDKLDAEPERAIRMMQQIVDGIAEPEDYFYFQTADAQAIREDPNGETIKSTR